jgi:hypothetical protein
VRLVGPDGYQGDVAWSTDCAADASGPGCLPWSAATGGGAPGSLVPGLVHSGREALRFDSGLTVRRGAAVLRNPVDGTPAVSTSGQYAQGDPGPGASGPEDCGLLAAGGATSAGVVEDLDDSPVCGSSAAAAVDAELTDALVGFAVTEATPPVPACSGSVIQIQPGRYDAARTRTLNTLLATCTNRTFRFLPGVFSFDANSGVAGPDRNALVFPDPGSFYVFGAPSGWDPASGVAASAAATDLDAPLCDLAQSGASIVLSGRTEIRHRGGRVAICPAFNPADAATPYPAIYQETSVPGVSATPTVALPRTFGFTWDLFACGFGSSCTVSRRHDVALATAGNRALSSVKVLVTGSEPDNTQTNLISNRTTRIEVWPASGGRICTTGEMPGIPNSGLTTAFELRTGACAAALTNEATLSGVTLRVFHSLRLNGALVRQDLTITGVSVQVNSAIGRSSAAEVQDPDGDWNDVGNVAADDAAVATPVMPCGFAACAVDGPRTPAQVFTHRLSLTGIDMVLPPELDPVGDAANLVALRLLVKLDPSSAALPPQLGSLPADFFRPEMTTQIELTTPAGRRCSVTGGFVNSAQEVAFDLFEPGDPALGCDGVLSTIGELQDAEISLRLDLPCVRNWIQNIPGQCMPDDLLNPSGKVWQVRPPNIQSISLAAASNSYSGPIALSSTDIGVVGGSTSSTFSAAGNVWMPRSDLDVHWKGAAPPTRPLVSGDLVLNGLGSDMTATASAGVVCCSVTRPDSRTVQFVSWVGGEPVLGVTVRFTDVDPTGAYSPGHAVDVLEWTTCGDDACDGADPP